MRCYPHLDSLGRGPTVRPNDFLLSPSPQGQAEKLREEFRGELRKASSFAPVAEEGSADLLLDGVEIWNHGYRRFSPCSHMKIPPDGTPIYGRPFRRFCTLELSP